MGLHLIVDDMEVRHTEFSRILRGHQLDHAYTVNEAIMFMRKRYFGFDRSFKEDLDRVDNYDVIFLDHDIDAG
jgi:CheY-like chemotaxis protein